MLKSIRLVVLEVVGLFCKDVLGEEEYFGCYIG